MLEPSSAVKLRWDPLTIVIIWRNLVKTTTCLEEAMQPQASNIDNWRIEVKHLTYLSQITIHRAVLCLFFLSLVFVANPLCLAQSKAQLTCEASALTGYRYCLTKGITCLPGYPNCTPHKGNPTLCLNQYSTAYANCQPHFAWTLVGGSGTGGQWPVAREGAAYWTYKGNFWLFGGFNGTTLGDFWKYTPSSTRGIPGTWKSISSATSMPGALAFPAFATDANGNLWLFGGQGSGAGYFGGYSSNLWEYAPSTGKWTLVSGPAPSSSTGVYGTKGVPSPANYPPPLYGAVSWIDAKGDFWLFGGQGGYDGWLSDTWEYVPGAGWAWIAGAGVFSASQCNYSAPSARVGASAWTDARSLTA